MRFHLFVGLAASGLLQGPGTKDSPKAVVPELPSRISDANYKKLVQGMSEAQALAILGPPDRTTDRADGIRAHFWEEINVVRVEYKEGKVLTAEGRFDPRVRSRSVNDANFRKVKKGMTRAEVEAILAGCPSVGQDGNRFTYEHNNTIQIQLRGGRVVGLVMSRSREK